VADRQTDAKALRTFDRMAKVYDGLTAFWSNGRVSRCKLAQLEHIGPGDKVLYVGVGTGEEAVEAVRKGADVTCLDLASEMIEIVRSRLAKNALEARLIHGDMFDHHESYDVVCANFFLDCFDPDGMRRAAEHLIGLVRPGGRFLVSDVTTPQGSLPARWFTAAHHSVAFAVSRLQGLTPWYPVYDYPSVFEASGLEIVEREFFALWNGGPVVYQALAARKPL